jgi:alanyl-tRNA synthetase
MTTDRLYYHDSSLLSFEAAVVERTEEGRRIYLDRTAFYPTSGGQPHDTGVLGGVVVVDVIDEDDRIAHLLAAPLAAGNVTGQIDAPRRRDHMEQHTGQHLLSAVFDDLFGHRTVSVHFGADSATIDLAAGSLSAAQAGKAETRANDLVREDRPVTIEFEEAAAARGLRKATDRQGIIRIVTIADLDRSACGGTHVAATGAIGSIHLRRIERAKQLVRVEFLCGGRAVTRARNDYDMLASLAAAHSAAPAELPELLDKGRAELKAALSARRELEERIARYRAAELYAAAAARRSGIRWLVERLPEGGAEALRPLGQAIAALEKVVLVGTIDSPPALLIATSADSGIDAGQLLKTRIQEFGGRGGGSPRVAQGSVPDQAALAGVTARLLDD